MIIRIKDDECRLTNVLSIFNLRINLLFERRFTKKDLQRSFDDNDLYMHITQDAEMFKTFVQNNIYIINRITFDIDEVALTASIIINENKLFQIVFSTLSAMTEQAFKHHFSDIKSSLSRQLSIQMHSNNLNKKFFVNENISLKNAIYTFFNIDVSII